MSRSIRPNLYINVLEEIDGGCGGIICLGQTTVRGGMLMGKHTNLYATLVMVMILMVTLTVLIDNSENKATQDVAPLYETEGIVEQKRTIAGYTKTVEEDVPGDIMLMPMGDGVLMPFPSSSTTRTKEVKVSDKYLLKISERDYWIDKEKWESVKEGESVKFSHTKRYQIVEINPIKKEDAET